MFQIQRFSDTVQAAAAGFNSFNECETLGVTVPVGFSTICARLPNGECITFAFVPYQEDGSPECVDIKYHGGRQFDEGRPDWHQQNVILFAGGGTDHRTNDERPTTLTTVLLK